MNCLREEVGGEGKGANVIEHLINWKIRVDGLDLSDHRLNVIGWQTAGGCGLRASCLSRASKLHLTLE